MDNIIQRPTLADIDSVSISELYKLSSTYVYKLDTPIVDLGGIFDGIEPTDLVPFVSWNNISKVRRGFTVPLEEWIHNETNTILVKYKTGLNYGDAAIQKIPAGIVIAHFNTWRYYFRNNKEYIGRRWCEIRELH